MQASFVFLLTFGCKFHKLYFFHFGTIAIIHSIFSKGVSYNAYYEIGQEKAQAEYKT